MRWLMEHADQETWRIECVGFGINSVTGCFEAPCLIVIDDETWRDRFGGSIQANWETEGLRRYSSLDQEILAELINDPALEQRGPVCISPGSSPSRRNRRSTSKPTIDRTEA